MLSYAKAVGAPSAPSIGMHSHSKPNDTQKPGHSEAHPQPKQPVEQDNSPLIISALLDKQSSGHYTALRDKYFPAHLNHLQSHITLFHALPAEHMDTVIRTLEDLASSRRKIAMQASKPIYKIGTPRSPRSSDDDSSRQRPVSSAVFIPFQVDGLIGVRTQLLETFRKSMNLTTQDNKDRFWPHATVVNKVDESEAKRVWHEIIPAEGRGRSGQIEGLELYRYKDGPWEHVRTFRFEG